MNNNTERIVILVDHANIFHNIQKFKIRIDYEKLEKILVSRGILIGKVIYLGVHNKLHPKKRAFITYLESLGWAVIKIPIKIKPKGKNQQKGIDIRIYKHAISFIQENICDNVILLSGDGDFTELVRSIKEYNKEIEVWSFRRSTSLNLIQEVGLENMHYIDMILNQIIKNRDEKMELKEKYIINIIKQTGLSRKELEQMIAKKQEQQVGISKLRALYSICKEYTINIKEIHDSLQI